MSKDPFFIPQRAGQRKLQLIVDRGVYDRLERLAVKGDIKVTELVRQMIDFALSKAGDSK